MALVLNDRVKETTSTTGTGTITFAGAVSGFETFAVGIGNSNTTYYCIVRNTEFEVGLGTSSGSGTATSDAISGTHLAIGRLYGGDWLLIPGHLKATVGDVTVQPSTSEKMTIEFMIFFE